MSNHQVGINDLSNKPHNPETQKSGKTSNGTVHAVQPQDLYNSENKEQESLQTSIKQRLISRLQKNTNSNEVYIEMQELNNELDSKKDELTDDCNKRKNNFINKHFRTPLTLTTKIACIISSIFLLPVALVPLGVIVSYFISDKLKDKKLKKEINTLFQTKIQDIEKDFFTNNEPDNNKIKNWTTKIINNTFAKSHRTDNAELKKSQINYMTLCVSNFLAIHCMQGNINLTQKTKDEIKKLKKKTISYISNTLQKHITKKNSFYQIVSEMLTTNNKKDTLSILNNILTELTEDIQQRPEPEFLKLEGIKFILTHFCENAGLDFSEIQNIVNPDTEDQDITDENIDLAKYFSAIVKHDKLPGSSLLYFFTEFKEFFLLKPTFLKELQNTAMNKLNNNRELKKSFIEELRKKTSHSQYRNRDRDRDINFSSDFNWLDDNLLEDILYDILDNPSENNVNLTVQTVLNLIKDKNQNLLQKIINNSITNKNYKLLNELVYNMDLDNNIITEHGSMLLYQSIINNFSHQNTLISKIEENIDLNQKLDFKENDQGQTPLEIAINTGSKNMISILSKSKTLKLSKSLIDIAISKNDNYDTLKAIFRNNNKFSLSKLNSSHSEEENNLIPYILTQLPSNKINDFLSCLSNRFYADENSADNILLRIVQYQDITDDKFMEIYTHCLSRTKHSNYDGHFDIFLSWLKYENNQGENLIYIMQKSSIMKPTLIEMLQEFKKYVWRSPKKIELIKEIDNILEDIEK